MHDPFAMEIGAIYLLKRDYPFSHSGIYPGSFKNMKAGSYVVVLDRRQGIGLVHTVLDSKLNLVKISFEGELNTYFEKIT